MRTLDVLQQFAVVTLDKRKGFFLLLCVQRRRNTCKIRELKSIYKLVENTFIERTVLLQFFLHGYMLQQSRNCRKHLYYTLKLCHHWSSEGYKFDINLVRNLYKKEQVYLKSIKEATTILPLHRVVQIFMYTSQFKIRSRVSLYSSVSHEAFANFTETNPPMD